MTMVVPLLAGQSRDRVRVGDDWMEYVSLGPSVMVAETSVEEGEGEENEDEENEEDEDEKDEEDEDEKDEDEEDEKDDEDDEGDEKDEKDEEDEICNDDDDVVVLEADC